jgi:HEAT repeat protein
LDEWRRRVNSAKGELADLVQAVNGMETIRDPDDAKRLETLLRKSGMPLTVKIPTAKALGEIVSNGLEPLATEVLQSNQSQRELLAASLLARHASQQASVVQRQLVDSSNSAVVAIAFRSLREFHPDLARELAISLCRHTDSHVRDLAIDVLSRHSDKQELVALVQCFEDENLKMRDKACKILVEKAKVPESKTLITELSNEMFQSTKSFAIEQAIILSVQLELRDRCRRFLELLDYPEDNVRIRAGWALQELANTPDIVEAVYAYTLPISEKLKTGERIPYADSFKLAHLLHVFGTNNVKSSEAMLRLYVPELDQRMNPIARAGAIWSLGIILEGTKDVALCEELRDRFLDLGPPSEFENVRYACAIAMGRIAGMQETDFFNSTGESDASKMGQAAVWAIAKQKAILGTK